MSSNARLRGTIRPRGGNDLLLLLIASAALSTIIATGTVRAAEGPPYLGRPLVDVLNEFRDGGLALIFSSASVGDDLRVTVEPRAAEPLEILAEILRPLGLRLGEGPAESLLILPRAMPGRVRGRVLSEGDGLAVRRASVRIAGSHLRARARRDGSFDIKGVPAGPAELTVEAFGFEGATLPVRVVAGEATDLVVRLGAKPSFSTAIVVTPEHRFVLQDDLMPQRAVDEQEAVLVPAIAGDVGRVIGTIPGVAASDNSAAFHVRGSTLDDVAIVLDGLELYDAFHLRSFQSPFSVIDGRIVDRIDFLGGGYTVDRGDRHGGFVDISTIQPEDDGRGVLALGTVNSGVSFGGPLGGSGATWLFSLRGWYPETEGDPIQLGGGERLDPRFGDLYGKVAFAGSPRFLVTAHALLAFDRIEFAGSSAGEPGGGESANVTTRNGYFWLRARGTPSESTTTDTVLSGGRIDRRRDGTSTTGADAAAFVRDHRVFDFLGLKHDSTWEISDSQILRAGIDLRSMNTSYGYSFQPSDEPAPASIQIDPAGQALGMYLAYRSRPSPRLATEVGLRWDRQSYVPENQFSPRINAAWLMAERSELLVALGEFHQSQRIHELRVEDGETEFLRAELSRQAELTFKHRFPGGLRLRIDGFYKELSRLRPRYENLFEPIELYPETRADRVRISPTRARLRGIEVLLRGKDRPALTWWVSYAHSAADDIVDGRPVPRNWDQSDSVRFLVGRRWGSRWTVSLSGTAHTGWPTTAVRAEIPTGTGESRSVERILGERNADRFDTYGRLDGKAGATFVLPRGRLAVTLNVINLTDRRNACCVDDFVLLPQPDGTVDVRRDLDYWPGLTPSVSLSWEF